MQQIHSKIEITTHGSGFTDVTGDINNCLDINNLDSGILIVNSMHTSCSLIVNENADPNVLRDLKKYMESIVPYKSYKTLSNHSNEIFYDHYQEGKDDMPAHIKTVLTNTSLSFSFQNKRLMLGTWQSIFLWEHRLAKKTRVLQIHAIGEKM